MTNLTIELNDYEKNVISKLKEEAKGNKKILGIEKYLEELFHKAFEDRMNEYDL